MILRKHPALLVWQRNYYEHVIRNEESLNRIRESIIAGNPARWDFDRENPAANNPEPNNVCVGYDMIAINKQGDRRSRPTMKCCES